jgi:hypothetical protein
MGDFDEPPAGRPDAGLYPDEFEAWSRQVDTVYIRYLAEQDSLK